jgi:hypothetical protein
MMHKAFIAFILLLGFHLHLLADRNDTLYYLQVGSAKCPLVLQEKVDSTTTVISKAIVDNVASNEVPHPWLTEQSSMLPFYEGRIDTVWFIDPVTLNEFEDIVKDTLVIRKSLSIADSATGFVTPRKFLRADTLVQINPVTLEEEMVITRTNECDINFNAGKLSFDALMKELNTGFKISRIRDTILPVEMALYFETEKDADEVTLKCPNPDKKILERLASLKEGGFVIVLSMTLNNPSVTEPFYPAVLIETGTGASHYKKNGLTR